MFPDDDRRSGAVVLYAYEDRQWVRDELLPRLEHYGFSYGVDFLDCRPGKPLRTELLRLLGQAELVLLVCSRHWHESPLASFLETAVRRLAAMQAIGPTLVLDRDGSRPGSIGPHERINCSGSGETDTWMPIYRALLRHITPIDRYPIHGELRLWRIPSERGYRGFAYLIEPLVGSMNGTEVDFDALHVEFRVYGSGSEFAHHATESVLSRHGDKLQLHWRFADAPSVPEAMDERRPFHLPSRGGIALHRFGFDQVPVTVPSMTTVEWVMYLDVGATPITDSCHGVLPPVLRLPDWDGEHEAAIALIDRRLLPPPSTVLDSRAVTTAFATARRRNGRAELAELAPRFITVHRLGEGFVCHAASNWRYVFVDSATSDRFEVHAMDPAWVDSMPIPPEPAARTLPEDLLARCNVDCRTAYLLARTVGEPIEKNIELRLVCETVDEAPRPVWKLPFRFRNAALAVAADDGAMLLQRETGWRQL